MLKGGVIGLGIKGSEYLTLISLDERTKLTGVFDLDERKIEEAISKYGVKRYNSVDLLLQECDFVCIATPDFAHAPYLLKAAEFGVDVLVEKPLTINLPEAEEIVKIIKKAKIKVQVAFANRFNQPFLAAKRSIKQGKIGEILTINTKLNDSIFVPTEMLSWAGKSSPGWFLMSHTMDLATWYKQKDVISVYATGQKNVLIKQGIDTYDSLQALIKFEDGTQASFESQWVLPEGVPMVYDFKFEIIGTKGSITIDTQDQMVHIARNNYQYQGVLDMEVNGRMVGQTAFTFQAFVDTLNNGENPVPTIDEGLTNVRLINAVHESAAKDKVIILK